MRSRAARLGIALLLGCLAACRATPPARPDIVLISIDTLARSALQAYDPEAPPLPNLDRFAREAVRFDDAIAAASWTLPSHASLMTGLYPDRHGATDPRVAISPSVATIAEALHLAGYETVAFTDGGLVSKNFGFARGFERYDDWARDPHPEQIPRSGAPPPIHGADIFDRAIAFAAQRGHGTRPFFLFLHTYAVHDYYALHPWATAGLTLDGRTSPDLVSCLHGVTHCDAATWQLLRALYHAEVVHLDAAFGRLLDALRSSGLEKTSVVVLVSDHGEGLDPERGRMHHGGRLDEDLIRVPLLVHAPWLAPRNVLEPVSLVDVMPTLLELTNALRPEGLDGSSFAPLLRGAGSDGSKRAIYAMEYFWSWPDGKRAFAQTVRARPLAVAAIQGGRWYIRSGEREQLFDLADARQLHELPLDADAAGPREAIAARMQDRAVSLPTERLEELHEQLHALGYVE